VIPASTEPGDRLADQIRKLRGHQVRHDLLVEVLIR
jgi:hypothetical protein